MQLHTTLLALTAAVSLVAMAGCDDGGTTTGTGGTGGTTTTTSDGGGGTGGTGGGGDPAPPKLGAQIDRFGRPAINTALNHTFDTNPEQKDMAKDAYNANGDPTKWASYVAEIEANLAILDGIDTVCGNQLLADTTKMDATRYATLATVLSDDRMYINMEGAKCSLYLGVEANAVGVTNADCGGRRLSYDVIDQSYTILAAGKLDGSIGDKVDISAAAKGETFPHLAAPQ